MPDPRIVAFDAQGADAEDEASAPFWGALREGRLAIPRCAHCGKSRMPPSLYCPHCRSTEVEWQNLSGHAVLYTYTISMVAPRDSTDVFVPALVSPVEVPEVRLFCNIVECGVEDLEIGLPLELVPAPAGHSTPLFRPS